MRAVLSDKKSELIKELAVIAERRHNGELQEHGILQRLCEQLAEKYGYATNSVRSMYALTRQEVLKKLNEKPVVTLVETPKETPVVKEKNPNPFYVVGDSVDVIVVGIVDYGAIVETDDANAVQGLIHVSRIANNYIPDIYDYFSIGQKIKNAIIVEKNEEGKLKLSTTHLNLTPQNKPTALGVKLEQLKIKTVEKEEKKPVAKKKTVVTKVVPATPAKNEDELIDAELNKIYKYLAKKIGITSVKAKEEIRQIVEKRGIVNFMIAAHDTLEDFEADLSMHFVNQLKEKVGGCL